MAIFAIVALGVAFFSGIGSSGLDMKVSGDSYFNEHGLMDIRVVSTYGLNENDIKAIGEAEGVEAVYPSYNIDALLDVSDIQIIVKVHSIAADGGAVNKPYVLSGRMPQAENEAVVERSFANYAGIGIGETFSLKSGKKADLRSTLKNVRYRAVGYINSPYYVSNAERGSSSIGNGIVNCFIYIPESNFKSNIYGEAFVMADGARTMRGFDDDYKDLIETVSDRIEEVGKRRIGERYVEVTENAFISLSEAEKELAAAYKNAAGEFERLHEEIDGARQSLEEARRELIIKQGDLHAGQRELETARLRLQDAVSVLDRADAAAQTTGKQLSGAGLALTEALFDIDQKAIGLIEREALLYAFYQGDPEKLTEGVSELTDAQTTISAARGALQENIESATAGQKRITESRGEIRRKLETVKAQLAGIDSKTGELEDAQTEIIGGYLSVSNGINELDRQLAILTEQESETYGRLDATAASVKNARKALNNLDKPKWYVLDRKSNPGYSGFIGDAEKVEAIGKVFPLIFFLVAALVSLTTMTRLVEERRIEIGTLKSLGYGDYKIMSKYMIYAALPTIIGGVGGGYFGMTFFPFTIILTYKSLYAIPKPIILLNARYWAIGVAIGAISTLVATLAACIHELRAPPAVLMRPKPPKRGARIFLERLPFIWNGVKFIWKVTIRNIVRYKKRLIMTVSGIAGCTALLMTGFGLRDSLESMVSLQYGDICHYNIAISFADVAKKSELNAVESILDESPIVYAHTRIRQKTYDSGSYAGGKEKVAVNLIAVSDISTYHEFITFRDRRTKKDVPFGEKDVVVTEKLARLLNVKRGDTFYILDDEERIDVTIADIVENYYMHYVYMSKTLYSELFGAEPEYNVIYVLLDEHTEEQKQSLTSRLLEKKGVGSIFLASTIRNTFNRVIKSLNIVVMVLITSAAALALVVLLNLTNININERKRELATIEVLGFYDREVSAYVYRENVVLTVIGVAAGLALGVFLHSYVIQTAEVDLMMFGRRINPESFLYSTVLTFAFATFVNIVTNRKLRGIDMVEALKSVE